MTDREGLRRKLAAVRATEARGEVSDSMDVRLALLAEVDAGRMTLDEVQAELKRLRRTATKNGKTTRARVWRRS